MNAGKSTSLLQVAYNYEEQGLRVRIFTSALDHRFGNGAVTSRLGPRREAATYDERFDFAQAMSGVTDVACVLVDEAQFLTPAQARQLHRVAHAMNVPVIAYGIRTDFRGDPFPGSTYLLALADEMHEIKNICTCGRKATMNVRVDEAGARITEGEQIAIEGTVKYRQVCGDCFYLD